MYENWTTPTSNGGYKKTFSKVALIDADRYKHVVVYRVFQEVIEKRIPHTRELVEGIIDEYLATDIFNCFEARAYIFCFSAPSKQIFRNQIAQEKKYKGNRDNRPDTYGYDQKFEDMAHVYEYINSRYPTLVFEDLEADDILSMLQHESETFIFSHDKDLKQVTGFHYNMQFGRLDYTTEEEGFCKLIWQMLLGDTTDNIPGLPKFGPKALEKFQDKCSGDDKMTLLIMAIKEYTDRYGVMVGFDMFAEMWHLLSMRLNRGEHCKLKYARGFQLINSLVKPQEV